MTRTNKTKNVLITGGSGALGRAVIHSLKNTSCYNIFTAGTNNSDVICDVRDKNQIMAAVQHANPDIILHLAATFSHDLAEAYDTNVQSSKHILDFIQTNKSKTRVILIGSAAEYGIVAPEENPIREARALAPLSIYGLSKAWQTQLMGLYTQDVDVLCARIFNLYGNGISDKLFAGRLLKQISEVKAGSREFIEVGSLSAIRDYISTENAAEQLLSIMLSGKTGKIYHVASGLPISMREFAHGQLQEHGLDPSILKEAESFSNHKGIDVPVVFADLTQTKELG